MESSKPNAFEAWQEAAYSGRYIHPETENNMPTTPPLKEEPKVIVEPRPQWYDLPEKKENSPVYVLVALFILGVVLLSFLLFPKRAANTANTAKKIVIEQNIEPFVKRIIKEIRRIPPPKTKIIRVKDSNNAAKLAQVKAWERVNNRMIEAFYSKKALSGKRTMCIKYGKDTQCTIIDTIDIRPELPGRLRRKTQARLDYL